VQLQRSNWDSSHLGSLHQNILQSDNTLGVSNEVVKMHK